MSIYYPQYKEQSLDSKPNCMCGDAGRSRNERECTRRGGCRGCGFDMEEHARRLNLIRDIGLKPITDKRRHDLRVEWGISPFCEIYGLRVGKKRRT